MTNKSNESYEWAAWLGAAIVCFVFLTIFLFILSSSPELRKYQNQETASWIQAFGSLIGIGIAIWVPFKIHKNEDQTQRRREASLTAVVITSTASSAGYLIGLTNAILEDLRSSPDNLSARLEFAPTLLAGFPIPSLEDIYRIGTIYPESGAAFAEARIALEGSMAMLSQLKTSKDEAYLSTQLPRLLSILENANNKFREGLSSLKHGGHE